MDYKTAVEICNENPTMGMYEAYIVCKVADGIPLTRTDIVDAKQSIETSDIVKMLAGGNLDAADAIKYIEQLVKVTMWFDYGILTEYAIPYKVAAEKREQKRLARNEKARLARLAKKQGGA